LKPNGTESSGFTSELLGVDSAVVEIGKFAEFLV
jgi:hypothetical protein